MLLIIIVPATVLSFSLSHGPASGGSVVTVTGNNFVDLPALLSCQFGSRINGGSFIAVSLMKCVSPAQPYGTVALEVSYNQQQYTTNNIQFTYDGMLCSFCYAILIKQKMYKSQMCPQQVALH